MALTFTLKLSDRRQKMAEAISAGTATPTEVEFDYRNRVRQDIEAFLEEAGAFAHLGKSEADRYEARELTKRLAEDITSYIVK